MCRKNQSIALIVLLLTSLLALSCAQSGQKNKKTQREAVAVTTMEVSCQSAQIERNYIGTARATKSTTVYASAPGVIENLSIRKGEKVSKGRSIAFVNSTNVKSSYEISQATLARAEDALKRVQPVYEQGSVSEIKMVEVRTSYEQAKAAAASATDALKKCNLIAPFDAYIDELYVEEAEAVEAFAPVCKLVRVDEIEIEFSVPEAEMQSIKEGGSLRLEFPALNITNVAAKVRSKGVSASPLSHSYNCIASLGTNMTKMGLLPGMVCKVFVQDPNKQSNIVIPGDVVFLDKDGKYVWVVEDNRAQKRRIEVKGYSPNGINVISGLEEGDKVITQGYQKVSTGTKVQEQ